MANPSLLLFGPPGAGKSALHDAFVAKKGPDTFFNVVDCSGQEALQMLQAEQPFAISHPMRRPILDADGVVLVVDVAAGKKQGSSDFRLAARWLKALHEYRGGRADVGDFPVYIVLAKSDLLAKKDDTRDTWINRIETYKHQLRDNFEKFLKQEDVGFGTIDLKVVATALKEPEFTGKSVNGMLGVGELFEDCFLSATDFQTRRRTSQSRLQNIVVGSVGLIALLGLAIAFLFEFQPASRSTALDEQVQLILPKPEATPAQRLQGTPKRLEEKLKQLTDAETHADFEKLPRSEREAVTSYRTEIAEYLQRYQDAQTFLKLPHLAKNQEELDQQEKNVQAFVLTEAQVRDWTETRLGKKVNDVRREYAALHRAMDKEDTWIRTEIDKTNQLLKDGTRAYTKLLAKDKDASESAEKWWSQLESSAAKPHAPRDFDIPGVTRMIWEDLGKFAQVQKAHKEWVAAKGELAGISKLIEKKLKST